MQISKVEAQSQRLVQSHAWGHVVWHVWGGDRHKATATPLVLLHGGSGSWTHWIRNVEHFAQHRPVWALDIPGFGDSDLPLGVSDADGLVPYVLEVLAKTFQDTPIDLMGFSFGAMVAGLVAAENSQTIRKLFLVGSPGLGLMAHALPMRGMTPDMDEEAQRQVHRHNLTAMMLAHESSVTEAVIELQHKNVSRDRMRRRRIARTDVMLHVQNKWVCDVHGVWGERDALYTGSLLTVPSLLTKLTTFKVIPDAGHWVMYERAEAFHEVIDPLLTDVPH
jgi:2-hydroxy-6-oxonona-2,4-dienedioate hydrolase